MKSIFILFLLSSQICFSQNNQINIEFYLEGEKIDVLKQKIEIFFVCGDSSLKTIFKPTIQDSTFFMPDLGGYTNGFTIIKLKNDFYSFGYNNLIYNQKMKLVFKIDKIPFEKNKNHNGLNIDKKSKAIASIEFRPLEEGCGVVSLITILNFKKYLKASKQLLM